MTGNGEERVALGCPELRACVAAWERAVADAKELAASLDDAQINWSPEPGQWSIAECLAHLDTTWNQYRPPVQRAIERGHREARVGGAPYRKGPLGGRLILAGLGPDPPFGIKKVKAPRTFRPSAGPVPVAEALSAFERTNRELREAARAADGLQLDALRFASPVSPLFRLDLHQAFRILALHEGRHLAQARGVRRSSGFPDGATSRPNYSVRR